MELKDLSNAIIRYRANHDITQAEFASIVNVTCQTISNIENCRRKPNRVTECKILQIINQNEEV